MLAARRTFAGLAGHLVLDFAFPIAMETHDRDWHGKGLSGGEISIRPFRQAGYAQATHENTIVGNTCLYGATGGRLFAAGQAASRFAVRNSGAIAVVEGAGNHCCEYMTGGIVVVLGPVGRNFGAGMSNGAAYVLDETGGFPGRVNLDMVRIDDCTENDGQLILGLVHEHLERTGSLRARQLIEQWEVFRPLFRKVVPNTTPTTPTTPQLHSQPTIPEPAATPGGRPPSERANVDYALTLGRTARVGRLRGTVPSQGVLACRTD